MPLAPAVQDRFDEANSARLGLISVQERIPDNFTRWDVELAVDDHRSATLTCISPAEYGGVPHGLDGDFATILNVMYIEQGAPESGIVETTAYQLLQRAGFADSGQYYQALQSSLDRLKAATYTASESWRDHKRQRWTTVKFNIIERIQADGEGEAALAGGTRLRIQLANPVTESIRQKYLKPLDMTFVLSLKRSLTRSLYRMLDARRHEQQTLLGAVVVTSFCINLQRWAEECKLRETMPARIKRNLEGAHKELIERGYLRSVSYEGQRHNTHIVYVFAEHATSDPAPQPSIEVIPDDPLVERLRGHGVAASVARRLLGEVGPARILERLIVFEQLLASGYKARSKSALLVDVVRDDSGKYSVEGAAPPSKKSRATGPLFAASEGDNAASDFEDLAPTQKIAQLMGRLQFMTQGRAPFSEVEKALLRELLASGALSPEQLREEMVAAIVGNASANFLQRLRERLAELAAQKGNS